MMKYFNAIQLVGFLIGMPYLIYWLNDCTFYSSSALTYLCGAIYVAQVFYTIYLYAEKIERDYSK